jgi:hypothetical protein
MECIFVENKDCPKAEEFDKWKNNKYETACLMFLVCPECPIYKGEEHDGQD